MSDNEYDQETIDEGKKSGFEAIPAGQYVAQIDSIEIVPASNKKESLNHQKQALNTRFSIVEGPYKGRVFFARVANFPRWAPSENSPAGAVARDHFTFYGAVGVTFVGGQKPDLPDYRSLTGKKVGIRLSVKPANEYNDAPFNEVSGYLNASDVKAATGVPATAAPVAAQVWTPPANQVTVAPSAGDIWGTGSAASVPDLTTPSFPADAPGVVDEAEAVAKAAAYNPADDIDAANLQASIEAGKGF